MHTIHPSVIMNISEHYTRAKPSIVVGALLGRKKEIIDSFDLRKDPSSHIIDVEYFHKKCQLIKQVCPDLDLIGWYSIEINKELHSQVSRLIPNPIFVKLDPEKRDGLIPIQIFESGEELELVEATWTIVTEDVEIIGLDNAQMPHVNVAPSAAIDNLMLQHSAVKMLKDRIKMISKYVKDVQAQKLNYDESTIADIAKLCQRFPLMNLNQYTEAYNVQCNDVALNTYLGILTKGSISKMHFGVPILKTRAYSSTHARR